MLIVDRAVLGDDAGRHHVGVEPGGSFVSVWFVLDYRSVTCGLIVAILDAANTAVQQE